MAFNCTTCGRGEDRCRSCQRDGRRVRHSERVLARVRVPGGVRWEWECECGSQ